MKRVKYVSQFASRLSRRDIDELVGRASEKNSKLDITGILMSSGRVFFQVLEGPKAHVDQVFQSIVDDDRHRDVLLLDAEDGVSERYFPDWSMRKFDLDDDAIARLEPVRELLVTIVERRKEIERLTHNLEKAVWYELATGAS